MHKEEYLSHHGILGQRWGVRKDRRSHLNNRSLKKRKPTIFKKRKKNINELSNKELNKMIKRMMLESKYKELSNKERSIVRKNTSRFIKKYADVAINRAINRTVDNFIDGYFSNGRR